MPLYPCIRDAKELRTAYARYMENEAARALRRRTSEVPSVTVYLEGSFEVIMNFDIVAVHVSEHAPTLVLLKDRDGKQQFVVVDPLEETSSYRLTAIDRRIEHGRNQIETMQRLVKR